MIISRYKFAFYDGFDSGGERYPDLRDSAFVMNLQAGEEFLRGVISFNFATKGIEIYFYNENDELIQPKIPCCDGLNLFYHKDFYLIWDLKAGEFVFGRGDSDEILQNQNR